MELNCMIIFVRLLFMSLVALFFLLVGVGCFQPDSRMSPMLIATSVVIIVVEIGVLRRIKR